ncbi:unnamed protein product, partial [Cylicocyclus nassatus]
GCWELIAYGILLNIIGAGCLLLKAIIDKGNTEALIHQKLESHGTGIKPTEEDKQKGPHVEISSVLVVIITMAGRMANVVGTMKLYKGLGKFFSDRKRKKFRKATERVQNGETEVEITELFADCCQCF